MTLLERMKAAVHTASQAEAASRQATVAELLDEVALQVRALRLRLVAASERREALKSQATGVADWPDPAKALASLTAFRLAFESEPTGGKAEFRKLVTTLTKVVEAAEVSVSEAIDRCRKSLRDNIRPLEDLGSVEGFVERVAAAKQDAEALLTQDWKRANGEALARLLVRWANLQARFDSLVREDVPKAVRLFFRAARGGGAPLDLLTAEVVTWLNDHGKRDKVRLVVR